MGVLEKIRAEEKKAEKEGWGSRSEIKGPTLKEILKNNQQNELFGLFLDGESDSDELVQLAARLKMGDLKGLLAEDMAKLDEKRLGFLEIIDRANTVIKALDIETIKEVIEQTDGLRDIAGLAGPESMRKAIVQYLPRLAVTDRELFRVFSNKAEALQDSWDAMKEEDDYIKELCDEYGINEDEYVEAMQPGNQDQLRGFIKDGMGFFRRNFPGGGLKKKVQELDRSDAIGERLKELNGSLRGLGGIMRVALLDNETMNRALVAELQPGGEAPKLETGMPFSEVQRLDEGEFSRGWLGRRNQYLKDTGTDLEDGMHDTLLENEMRSYSNDFINKRFKGKKGGFWARATQSLWKSAMSDIFELKL